MFSKSQISINALKSKNKYLSTCPGSSGKASYTLATCNSVDITDGTLKQRAALGLNVWFD